MKFPDYRDYRNDLNSYLQDIIDAGFADGKGAARKIASSKIPIESKIQREVMDRLTALRTSGRLDPNAFFYKQQAGPYGIGGLPDITLLARCRLADIPDVPQGYAAYIGLEVKRPMIGQLTPLQKRTIQRLFRSGALVFVVHSANEAETNLRISGFLTEG